jgi:hypothetical protein
MRILNCFRALLLFWVLPCPGQHVKIIPDIGAAEAEYRDANEACLKNDPGLERDLFKADPEQMRRRIHRAASLRDDAMAKKEVYLKAEIQRLRVLQSRLTQGGIGTIPTEAERKSLVADQARTLAEQSRVEKELAELPEGDESLPKRRALDQERSHLINLQNTLIQRIQSLEGIDKAQQALSTSTGDTLTQKLEEIVKLWEQERDSASTQRAHWARLYAAMEQSLEKKAPEPGPPPKRSKKKPPRSAAPASPPSARNDRFDGTGTYPSQPAG